MVKDRRFLLLLACFVLSGVAGLIYETAWTQQFALVFGTSELAVATVLAAYMAGLMAGAAAAGRLVNRVRRPLRVYALLELGIALSALAVPAALKLANRLQALVLGGLEVPPDAGSLASALFYLAAAFAILLVPTGLMGATLPLLARHAVRRDLEIGPRVALLYGANTAGAAAGTLLAAFVLLPRLGLGWTVLAAVAVNVLVFLLAAWLAAGDRIAPEARPAIWPAAGAEAELDPAPEPPRHRWILPLILISGFVSFSWEVLWTRLLSNLLGGSIYAFGTMLATFLAGIALGSAIAARRARSRQRARSGFAVAQLGIAASSLAAFAAVDRLPQLAGSGAASGDLLFGAPIAAATLLPGALFIGATFPFAVRILTGNASQAGPASARVYAWNTLGAIGGAVATGFVLLPGLRLAGTAAAAVAASLAVALAASLLATPRLKTLAAVALAGLALLAASPPRTPWQVLRTAPLSGKPWPGEVNFYGVGRSATVLLLEHGGEWRLTTNGLPESAIQSPGGRPGRFAIARWLALLPVASRPDARSYLIVGLGAGVTLEAIPQTVVDIHLVELEPEVIRANRSVAGERRQDPLADPRLKIYVNDARSALALSDRRFDAIVSQPSHPWTAGASHLFTREFFALVRQRLRPEGVFVQWIGLRFVDEMLVRSLLATLLDVFPHVEAYMPPPGGGLLFLAGLEPLAVEEAVESGLAAGGEQWRGLGVLTPEDVLAARVLDRQGARRLAAGAALTTDSRNLLQTRSPRILHAPLGGRGADALLAEHDPLTRLDPGANALYYVRRLLRLKAAPRARRVAAAIRDPVTRQTAFALLHLASGRRARGEGALRNLAARQAGASEALYAWMLLEQRALRQGRPPAELAARLERDPLAAAVLEGWRLASVHNHQALRQLESRFAAADPRHPLFEAATGLRIIWRQAGGDPSLAAEALDLLEPQLTPARRPVHGLIRRAALAAAAADPEAALASLLELAPALKRQPSPVRARQALGILESLPDDAPGYERLHADLTALLAVD